MFKLVSSKKRKLWKSLQHFPNGLFPLLVRSLPVRHRGLRCCQTRCDCCPTGLHRCRTTGCLQCTLHCCLHRCRCLPGCLLCVLRLPLRRRLLCLPLCLLPLRRRRRRRRGLTPRLIDLIHCDSHACYSRATSLPYSVSLVFTHYLIPP